MEKIDIEIKEKGKIKIVISDKHEDGATALLDAINSLDKAGANYVHQIKTLEDNIKSNKEAIKFTLNNIKYITTKKEIFEIALGKLKKMGYKPKVIARPKLLKNDVENKNK